MVATDESPYRSELFSIDLLERHARRLAECHQVGVRSGPDRLLPRLGANQNLLHAYNERTLHVEKTRRITPASEWLLDNFYLIEEQIRMARRHLPRGYSRELPHLTKGPTANLPRVYDLALELISHVDGRIDAPHLIRFVAAYQEVCPLKLGELWAIPIMLRLALIENLRRVAALLDEGRKDRDAADQWANRMLDVAEIDLSRVIVVLADMAKADLKLTPSFVTEFWNRIQQKTPALKLALNWVEERLAEQGMTIEQLVQSESQRQAANQVSVGNSISSLRFLDSMNWREFVEALSVVEHTLRRDPADVYPTMDFLTRDAYRHILERISRFSQLTELEVASLAVGLAKRAASREDRQSHVGYYLLDRGLPELESQARMKLPFAWRGRRLMENHPLALYLGSITLLTAAGASAFGLLATVTYPGRSILALIVLLGIVSASQLAIAIVNWLATLLVQPRLLPRLDFAHGIPPEHRTMVVVPTLLTHPRGIDALVEALEVRYLGNRDPNVFFALLTDFGDAHEEHLPADDHLVRLARNGIAALNAKYRDDRPNIFYLFHRPRRWNELDQVWMGHERKRGKLADFNRFLRGGARDSFTAIEGDVARLPRIQYVITLDTDTQLPRDAARQLVGAMAHPLNAPVFDPRRGRVIEGYGILQPRVAVSLPSASRSRFTRLFSGDPGIDPYTRTVSDVYQDLFHEGSFVGKGIYDVDAFERAVGGKFPENRILSHDLLEGSYARSALITDVQLFEEFPTAYTADVRRRHRWMRGDWQIATWLLPRVPGSDVRRVLNPIGGLSRWKIFDNLRRSLAPLGLLCLLVLGWFALPGLTWEWSALVLLAIFLPGWLPLLSETVSKPKDLPFKLHLNNVVHSASRHLGQAGCTLIFLPFDACVSLDAAVRTAGRLIFTRRNLLQWQTASDTERSSGSDLASYWRTMWWSPALSGILLLGFLAARGQVPPVTVLFLLLWALAPLAAWWLSQPIEEKVPALSEAERQKLRRFARKTWRYFEEFAAPLDNWLPPDNFQEHPNPVIATRTSPTNMGMALIGCLAAWDFGYLSLSRMIGRLRSTLGAMEKLEGYRGHFYNWYDTRTLKPLLPLYVSTVDNGNLSGLLLTLRAGLLEIAEKPWPTNAILGGIRDAIVLLEESMAPSGNSVVREAITRLQAWERRAFPGTAAFPDLAAVLGEVETILAAMPASLEGKENADYAWWRSSLDQLARDAREDLLAVFPWLTLNPPAQFSNVAKEGLASQWLAFHQELGNSPSLGHLDASIRRLGELRKAVPNAPASTALLEELAGWEKALLAGLEEGRRRRGILEETAAQCDRFARMDFTLLYDSTRKLFSIGYSVTDHRLDASYYDLLASEARLTSFVAIALGQVPQEHWFALGRLLTAVEEHRALISWSGSMFEYLMPALVMPSYEQTLLDVSSQSAVECQIHYGKQRRVPWGISESGYFMTDASSNYQYRAFGVPGLGFRRGLAEDLVIAPYATMLALLVRPVEACANLERLRAIGAEGRFGFHEAVDYTASRLQRGQTHAVLRSFMAHHQGMSLLALTYQLLDRPMQRRFQANPYFRAAELLLQERVPRETTVFYPHELEAGRTRATPNEAEATFRVFTNPSASAPEVHLLSNGRYHVMVSSAGGGYSVWNGTALTRWREDPTRDCWGTYVFLRDLNDGLFWSAAFQPVGRVSSYYEAIFSQGRAEFRTRFAGIDSHLEISVSPEDDVEVRRMTLTNHTAEARSLEITSFAEVALNSVAADLAHPAFSKLFVQTEIIPSRHAVVCGRRPRARDERPPWMFQLVLLHGGEEIDEATFETDRARFLGRGRTAANPAALEGPIKLSNCAGSVLDAAVSIRRSIRIESKSNASATVVMGAAPTREALLALIDKYQDQSIADRVFELAWTHGLVALRHLNATERQAQLFGRLAGALLYQNSLRRANPAILNLNRRGQQNLWSLGISGDLPIVLLRVADAGNIELVREILQAHAYWRMKGLGVDLVLLNEDESAYRQSVHDQMMSLIASGIEAHELDKPGGIFIRRADQLSREDVVLLQAAARIVLSNQDGPLAEQRQRRTRPESAMALLTPPRARPSPAPVAALPSRDLIFGNGFGGFTRDGREYIITLMPGQTTPAPWVNVMANPSFGTLISESGSAYSWSENCHEFRLTPWSNDPVTDSVGEAIYIRDEQTAKFWSPTPLPTRRAVPYVARHGFGYSVFELTYEGITSELWVYVAVDAPVKIHRLILRNSSGRERTLSIFGYWEWVLGELRQKNLMHIVTEFDRVRGALLARNPFNIDFEHRIAFAGTTELIHSRSGDRTEFLGRLGSQERPAALARVRLSNQTGAGFDPCAALQINVTLAPGEERELFFTLGAGQNRDQVQQLLSTFQSREACRNALAAVHAHWNSILGAVYVETPDLALNVLANGWLLYQTISCRLWGRTGFYQSGGAFGFRDQLQDTMALVHSRPDLLREQLLRAAAHQFPEGDVQHWWHPPLNRGVRTHFSDDYLWLPYAACRYVETVGDTGVLDEKIPFLEGRAVRPEEESYYDTHHSAGEPVSFYEHCVRAVKNGLRFGEHGLPLMGCGDWNDGMNLVGGQGKGESVWLGFFLYDVLNRFSNLARLRGDTAFADDCVARARRLREDIENHGWDGQWYRRAYFDDGQPLGSASNPECQIDALPQSWSILAGVSDPKRARTAMDAVAHRLVRREEGLIQLFDPPFDKSALEPGYVKGYLPGVRENGGQYTHAAVWTVMAFATMGDVGRAWELFDLINPVRHALTPEGALRYKVEPYVVAADVYSVHPHVGRGGWTWYTGSAGWLYRLITETFLGLRLEVDKLRFAPALPPDWRTCKIHYRHRAENFHIQLQNVAGRWTGPQEITLDGVRQAEPCLPLRGGQGEHFVEIRFL